MNFQFSEEAEALREQARRFLEDKSGREKARAVMESGVSHDAALWAEIVALGWTALRIPEEHGGLGLSVLELCVLAEEIGRVVSPVPFTSSVLLATEALIAAGTDAPYGPLDPWLAMRTAAERRTRGGALTRLGQHALRERAVRMSDGSRREHKRRPGRSIEKCDRAPGLLFA